MAFSEEINYEYVFRDVLFKKSYGNEIIFFDTYVGSVVQNKAPMSMET